MGKLRLQKKGALGLASSAQAVLMGTFSTGADVLRLDVREEAILWVMAALSLSPVRQGKLRIVDTDLKSKCRPSISLNRLE